jgi:hypothetical protein
VRIEIKPMDAVLAKVEAKLLALGENRARLVLARALNHEMMKTRTKVRRGLAKQSSIPAGLVAAGTKLRKASASTQGLAAAIVGTGKPLPLKIFKPKQGAAGTSAFVWGHRKMFKGAFMGPRPGILAPGLHGHVWHRDGRSRLPIHKEVGPGIANELIKDLSLAAFKGGVNELAKRVSHEIKWLLESGG